MAADEQPESDWKDHELRLLAFLVILLFAFGLATFVGCGAAPANNDNTNNNDDNTNNNDDTTNTDPAIDGLLALDAMPRSVVPGGTTTIVASASDADAGDTISYVWAVATDDAALGTVAEGETTGTAIFTAADGAAEESVATVTLTVTDSAGGTVTASVDITITSSAAFLVPEGSLNGYVGAETCARCHSRFVERTLASAHGVAEYADARAQADFDGDWTNVQCEDCHGPGHDHATNPSQRSTDEVPWDRIDVPTYEVCETCHSEGTSAPATWTEWAGIPGAAEGDPAIQEPSGHANSMEPMNDRDSSCLDCHSGTRIELWQDVVAPVAAALLTNDPITAEEPITCLVCHSPHSATARDSNSDDTFGLGSTCMECHVTYYDGPGFDSDNNRFYEPRYNPAGDVIQGLKGFAEDGTELAGDASAHLGATDADGEADTCVVCHVYPSETSTGHTFLFRDDDPPPASGCMCHPSGLPEDGRVDVAARIAALAPYIRGRTSWGASFSEAQYTALTAEDQARYQVAVWDYALARRDSSDGAHNMDFIEEVLDVAEGIINDVAGAAL